MLSIKSKGDLFFGGFLTASGVLALQLSRPLAAGTAASMGAGYFPILLAWLSVGFGVFIGLRGFLVEGEALEPPALRPLMLVSLAIGAFMAIEVLGLLLAVMVVTVIAGMGDRETRSGQNLLLATFLGVFSVLVFAVALRIPFPLWPRWPVF